MDVESGFDQAYICDNEGNILSSGYLWSSKGEYMELRGSSFHLYDQGEKIKAIIEYRNGKKEIVTAYVYISQEQYISLLVISKKIDSEQRKYFRAKTRIKSEIIYEFSQNKTVALTTPVDICMLDICLGGMLVGSDGNLDIGKSYKTDIVLNGNRINVIFKIVRKLESEKWGNEYGCMFQNVMKKSERDICQYIFDIERQKRVSVQNIL